MYLGEGLTIKDLADKLKADGTIAYDVADDLVGVVTEETRALTVSEVDGALRGEFAKVVLDGTGRECLDFCV